jgi:hypothetical protein
MSENACTAESEKTHVLKLEGCWTIERANELKDILLEAFWSGDHVVLDVAELEDADLSCLQLFCSAHRTFLRLGKRLAFDEKKSENFKRVVCGAGFRRNLGCHKDPRASCLWIGEWQS